MRAYLRSLRPEQWVKNLLVFAPVLAAHRVDDPNTMARSCAAFLAFCLFASAGYLLNDRLDLENDRAHPFKRLRPLASGEVNPKHAAMLIPLLAIAGSAIAFPLSPMLGAILWLYFGLSCLYSFHLKTVMVLDVVCLGTLYALRIVAGHEATQVPYSEWLIAFALFLFTSLAFLKRFAELKRNPVRENAATTRRDYRVGDLPFISQVGSSSGIVAVLVLALYIQSKEVTRHYVRPDFLWLLCPVLLYWIGRVWLLASRNEVDEDPIVFALRDRASYLAAVAATGILLLAKWAGP